MEAGGSSTLVYNTNRDMLERQTEKVEFDVEAEDSRDPFQDVDVAASTASTVSTFKANLERFKHEDQEDMNATKSLMQIRRSTRNAHATCELPTKPWLATAPGKRGIKKRTSPDDQDSNATPSPAKKKSRLSTRYAPPSKYAHLSELTDILEPNLICIFVGTNPGIRTATAGHAYAHPSNMFWKLLHSSGCTDTRLDPTQDVDLPRLYSMGNTNIVARPSKDASELSKDEMAAGTPILEDKVRKFRPEAVCIVGKGIWEAVFRWRYGRGMRKDEFRFGWQDERDRMGRVEGEWEGAKVFVATSTSGLAASLRPAEKEAIWRPFGSWVKQRRKERSTESHRPNA